MFVLRCVITTRVGISKMHPHFMVAVLIFFTKTQCAVGDRKRTVQAYLPFLWESGLLDKPAYTSPFAWHHTWSGARWHRQVCIGEFFFNNTGGVSIVVAWDAPSGTVEVPSNQVHMLLLYHSAD